VSIRDIAVACRRGESIGEPPKGGRKKRYTEGKRMKNDELTSSPSIKGTHRRGRISDNDLLIYTKEGRGEEKENFSVREKRTGKN